MLQPLDALDFFTTLTRAEGPNLVVFGKRGCGACRAMKAALDSIAVPSWFLDVEDGPGLVDEYEIELLPTLFLWCDGEYHARLSCPPRPIAIVEAVAAALAKPPEPEP